LVVLCLFLAFNTDGSFLKGNNIENLIRRTSMYGILGIGVAFVIITSGIDLSIGSVVCLAGCLLTIFLQVDYEPFVGSPVIEVKAAAKQILLPANVEKFKPGNTIRYYGGRRARDTVLQIVAVEQSTNENGLAVTRLTVDSALTRNDDDGDVALMTVVSSFADSNRTSGTSSEITLAGRHDEVAKRDQLLLVSGKSLKKLRVTAAKTDVDTTILQLNEATGELDESWMAIPLERRQKFSIPVALGLVLGTVAFLGLVHGILVTRLKLQPFIVTLCGLLIYRSISRWMVGDRTMGFGTEYQNSLNLLATGKLSIWQSADGLDSFGIPYPLFVLLVTAVVAGVFLNKTIWGRYMLALGRNEEAARYSGINTGRITLLAYVISALLAAVGGIIFALDSNSVAPSTFGSWFELYAIAAAVLGGCSLRGGEGGILGVVIGTALMQTLYNLIVLMKISDTLEHAIIGAVILGGVIADEVVRRVVAKRRAVDQAKRQLAET
jgi:ribose transport system permease protein